ncbi:MAG: ATP synthase F0 subunit B [Nitrospiraceae bacterium]|nr:ATP synthase F0 subunit B [Nitrospiraceae bacterium]
MKDSLDQAEQHRSEAERKFKEYEAKLNSAAKEAEGILVAAKERAQRLMEENGAADDGGSRTDQRRCNA